MDQPPKPTLGEIAIVGGLVAIVLIVLADQLYQLFFE